MCHSGHDHAGTQAIIAYLNRFNEVPRRLLDPDRITKLVKQITTTGSDWWKDLDWGMPDHTLSFKGQCYRAPGVQWETGNSESYEMFLVKAKSQIEMSHGTIHLAIFYDIKLDQIVTLGSKSDYPNNDPVLDGKGNPSPWAVYVLKKTPLDADHADIEHNIPLIFCGAGDSIAKYITAEEKKISVSCPAVSSQTS